MTNERAVFHEIRNYLAGQFTGGTRDEILLEEIIKCLFVHHHAAGEIAHLLSESEREISEIARFLRKTFRSVVEDFPGLFEANEEVLLGAEELVQTFRLLAPVKMADMGRDIIGDAYEVFIGSALRGQEGQFFTPRNAIDFLVQAVDPAPGEVIIDPACGTGGFLGAVLVHLRSEYSSANKIKVFGIDKDASLVRLARIHLALLGADYSKVFLTDSIAVHNGGSEPEGLLPCEGKYDVVLTNPPFGARIVSAKAAVAARYRLAKKWELDSSGQRWRETLHARTKIPPQLLFVEKCVKLLKPGGRCGMVVPESLLSSAQYRFVVEYLRQETELRLVVGMPEALFKTSGKGGTHTKTCLVVFDKKGRSQKRSRVFLAEATWCGNDSRGRTIDRDDLGTILKNYRRADQGNGAGLLGFSLPSEEIKDWCLAPRRYDPGVSVKLGQLKKTHDLVKFGELVMLGIVELSTGDEVGKMAYGSGTIPFIRTSDLSNWEIKSDAKQGVGDEVYDRLREKQDVRENDILMVKDGTYLIGTCAMVTNYDTRIVYQSHLYKIRVPTSAGLWNPFLLLACLSSSIVQEQIRAQRVTHDIIDSLGGRINDLIVPIPKDARRRNQISKLVARVIQDRVEARELSRKARELVTEP